MKTPRSTSGLVQLVTRRPRAGQVADSEFFTTWKSLEAASWRSDLASGLLQMAPSEYFGLRCFAHEFRAKCQVSIEQAIARANPQFGPGGGEKIFIPAAAHAEAIEPIGDLILLDDAKTEPVDSASGSIAELIALELSLGNSLVAATRSPTPSDRLVFWLQEALHIADIERAGVLAKSARVVPDDDIHGNTVCVVGNDEVQVIVSPGRPPTLREMR